MDAGDSFVRGVGKDGHHLWVVISDPFQDTKQILIVNLTTVRGSIYDDLSCVFDAGEHGWITHRSFVDYYYSEVHTEGYLDGLIKSGAAAVWPQFTGELLERIRRGADVTENLIGEHLQILRDQGLV